MELKVEGELCLRGFSPHQVSYLPSLNCVLVSDGRGAFRCVDIAPEITVPDVSPHVLCDVDQTTSKLVVVCGNKLSARLAHAGALQLRTMLQTPVKSMQEEVTVELPLSAVASSQGDGRSWLLSNGEWSMQATLIPVPIPKAS
ncbi:baculoviral IAP repeat-containing protein 6-like isoform X3 [Halichondria panicea]|uniref:baculoviral IAP repeat-containing protein 6-like isoform X3 n=1 Tax=Halichondria panicea TaxID=6063 RepID=UPI00312B5772